MANVLIEESEIDVNENEILHLSGHLLDILLKDHSTGKNIVWASDYYLKYGDKYGRNCYITADLITGKRNKIIKPRTCKSKADQHNRSRDVAEVFTPSWICNEQINLIDEAWLNYKHPFNFGYENGKWITNYDKIIFDDKKWSEYVFDTRMEISCGEAPYLVSRYDTVTGDFIQVVDRIGILDRKIRVINENCSDDEWYAWVKIAFENTYGFDMQGDNVLLSRENLILSFIDYYNNRFNENPSENKLLEIADIISWNIWQMDALKYVVPNSCVTKNVVQADLLGEKKIISKQCVGCVKSDIHQHNGTYCVIKDWKCKKKIRFVDLVMQDV